MLVRYSTPALRRVEGREKKVACGGLLVDQSDVKPSNSGCRAPAVYEQAGEAAVPHSAEQFL